jgi:2-keto-3-deoxy-L-rhamnonate aldolase RhmA/quercetin dioxygenase-like cupin family protein
MKTKALTHFRSKLDHKEPVYGLWVTLESPSITEMAVALGMDWVVVDAEHGHLDWKEINEHIRAAVRSDTVVLVRLQERSTSLTKRALDIGADGVVIPWVSTVDDLEQAIRDARYPTEGLRGIGGERATAWGQCLVEHAAEANDQVMVIPLIENIAAIPNVPAMCEVDGTEMFFFGPADFSSSAGFRGQWEGPGVAEQILQLKDAIQACGKHCGLMSTSLQNLVQRRDQGFNMLGVGADNGLLLRGLHQALQAVDRDRLPAPSLDPVDGREVRPPLLQPPADKTPDRDEVITSLGEGQCVELEPGVVMETLVGSLSKARGLTTGVVTIQPEAMLRYHRHPNAESVTVLEGEAEISTEGRTYRLGPLDNITIPRWLPHQTRNPNTGKPARLHVAMASSTPERDLVACSFDPVEMSLDSTGTPGFERVTRFASAERVSDVDPGVESIDYFNGLLMPGIEMSGGFVRFEPGGRLPDHMHDFDQSICIIRGHAHCRVEGRKYALTDCTTAMVPRGRVHYFINESENQMDMIWAYAGPIPERIAIEPGFIRD